MLWHSLFLAGSLMSGAPNLEALEKKQIWAVVFSSENVAFVYSQKKQLGSGCQTTSVAYVKKEGSWKVEEKEPGMRLSLMGCTSAKPADFDFSLMYGVTTGEELGRAVMNLLTEIQKKEHSVKLAGKVPSHITQSNSEISFVWLKPITLEAYSLSWNRKTQIFRVDEYVEEID